MTRDEAMYVMEHTVLGWAVGGSDASEAIKMAIEALEEQKTGKWIDITKSGVCFMWKCSECGYDDIEDTNYCPNCGSYMRGEEE